MPSQEEVEDWSQHIETEEEFQSRLKVEKWGSSLVANSQFNFPKENIHLSLLLTWSVEEVDATKANPLWKKGPMIRFMVKHLAVIGCNPLDEADTPSDAEPKIAVGPCPPTIAGGFSPSEPGQSPSKSGILICSNRIMNKKHLEDTLAHEMIHWWDHCRFKVDWSDLRQHACSEVRAASLSGDCRWGREMRRANFGLFKQHQECARRRAVISITGNPACKSEQHAKDVVDDVFQSCFNDTRPFDTVCTCISLLPINSLTASS